MYDLEDWDLIDIYEILCHYHVSKKEDLVKRVELGMLDKDAAKEAIKRNSNLCEILYNLILNRMKKC